MKLRSLPFTTVLVFSVFSAATIVATPTRAQGTPPAGCVRLEVHNVRAEQGQLMIAAYGDAASFGKTPLVATQMRAGAETMSFAVCGLSGSSVALTLFQDLNGNGKLDANALGVPSEPWGASGKTVAMTAPSWDSSVVALDGSTVVVKLSK